MTRATLLFAHGGGFCKDSWEPILRRLRASPVVRAVPTELVTFDFSYHGSRRDESVTPVIDRSNPKSPRVHHPAQDLVRWTSAEVLDQVRAIRAKDPDSSHKLIGVGHSMGAGALWNTEIQHPGTFDGLVLFEPVYGRNIPGGQAVSDFLVALSLQREASWPSRAAAVEHFENLRNFEKWDRESLAAYLRGAVIDETDGTASLACHPHIEASLYCHELLHFEDEQLPRAKCKVTFHYGSRTKMFNPPDFDAMQKRWPDIYTLHPAMPNTSHAMVLENPELSVQRIERDLAQLDTYKPIASL